MYGDAARGCHHRGNGPDARQCTISHNRQRLGDLVIGAPRRNPWGCRGGTCRRERESRLTNTSSPPNHGTYRVPITWRRRYESWLLRRRPLQRSRLPRRRPRRRSNNFFNRSLVVLRRGSVEPRRSCVMKGNPRVPSHALPPSSQRLRHRGQSHGRDELAHPCQVSDYAS